VKFLQFQKYFNFTNTMSGTRTISIKELVRGDSALTPSSGDIVYAVITQALQSKEEAYIDFAGIKYLTSAFLNAAIGQLYDKFSSSELNEYLHLINLQDQDIILMSRVIEGARDYFLNKKKVEDSFKPFLDE